MARLSPAGVNVQLVPDNLLVVVVLAAGVFAPLTGWFAARRARQPLIWFLFGGLIGPLALALLALAPPGRCPSCAAPVDGWPSACRQCGRAFGSVPDPVTAVSTRSPASEPNGNVAEGPRVPRSGPPRTRRRAPSRAETLSHPQPPASSASATGEILSIGVFVSGNARLEIGARYGLARVPGPDVDRLRIFGPVDTGEISVRYEGPIDTFEVTALDDRVIISERHGRAPLMCVFRALGGMRGADLERAFSDGPVIRP